MDNSLKLFLISIFGILVIAFIGENFREVYSGEVLGIENRGEVKILEIRGIEGDVVLFDSEFVELTTGDFVYFEGNRGNYLGEEQIVVGRIWK